MKTSFRASWLSLVLASAGCGDDTQVTCEDGGSCDCEDACCQRFAECDGTTSTSGTTASTSGPTTGTTTSTTQASATTAPASNSATSTGTAMADAEVNLTFSGTCAPDFTGMIVVASNTDSVAVTATGNFSSVQLALQDPPASIALSTAERVANGDVINVVSQSTTWSNISSQTPDPISGTLVVNDYQEQQGIFDVVFQDVVLENVQNGSLCTVNGSLKAFGNSF